MGTGSLSRGKSGRGVALTIHPNLGQRLKKEYSYTFTSSRGLLYPGLRWTSPLSVLGCTEHVFGYGNRCGFGTALSITAGQMSTSSNERGTKARPLWMTVFVVQTSVWEKRDALSWLALVLDIPLSSARNTVHTLVAKNITDDQKLVYGTRCHVISASRRDVDEICALLGCYVASSGKPLPTFRDNVSVPSSRVKKSNEAAMCLIRYNQGCGVGVGRNFRWSQSR
jgi:hypothetical protein